MYSGETAVRDRAEWEGKEGCGRKGKERILICVRTLSVMRTQRTPALPPC